jgi:CubicO group peptidase (beta-lactamase class C family)
MTAGATFRQRSELPKADPADVGLSAEKLKRVHDLVQAAIDKNQSPGVVLLIGRHGKIADLEALGQMDRESKKPMRPDAIFRIYSMTKPITTVGALILVDRGLLSLDDPISKFIPEFATTQVYDAGAHARVPAKTPITVRDLMRHTSGFTYGIPGGGPVDQIYIDSHLEEGRDALPAFVHQLAGLPLVSQPGTNFNYSVSTDVLGRIIEIVSGQTLDTFLRNNIFRPLGMRDTDFEVNRKNLDRLATSYWRVRDGLLAPTDVPQKTRLINRPVFLAGGGGLVSTARDYARFCQMLLDNGTLGRVRILKPQTVSAMTSNQLPPSALPMSLGGFKVPGLGFGLGVSVRLRDGSSETDPARGEYGWSGSASTFFWVDPASDLYVIVLQQVEPINIGLQLGLEPAVLAAVEKN